MEKKEENFNQLKSNSVFAQMGRESVIKYAGNITSRDISKVTDVKTTGAPSNENQSSDGEPLQKKNKIPHTITFDRNYQSFAYIIKDNKGLYLCKVCMETFESLPYFVKHYCKLLNHSSTYYLTQTEKNLAIESIIFKCLPCNINIKSMSKIIEHYSKNHDSISMNCICKCQIKFVTFELYEQHYMRSHGKNISDEIILVEPKVKLIPKIKTYSQPSIWKDSFNLICEICDLNFISLRDAINHMSKIHVDRRAMYKCICNESFGSFYILQGHFNKTHLNMQLRKVTIKVNLRDDEKKSLADDGNEKIRDLKLDVQNEPSNNNAVEAVEPTEEVCFDTYNIMCQKCEIKFSKLKDLWKHFTHAHNNRPIVYQCVCCDNFSSFYVLKQHFTRSHLHLDFKDIVITANVADDVETSSAEGKSPGGPSCTTVSSQSVAP